MLMPKGINHMAILPNLAQELEALRAQNAQLQAQLANANKPKAITIKVSEKGAVSVYGLGRWPVTLYRSQMERLVAAAPQISAFIEANTHLLAVKAD
jgi:hypothetical protein